MFVAHIRVSHVIQCPPPALNSQFHDSNMYLYYNLVKRIFQTHLGGALMLIRMPF